MADSTWTEGGWGAVAGLLYGMVLWYLALGAAGGGHGPAIPLLLTFGPFALLFAGFGEVGLYGGPLVWAGYGYLLAVCHRGDRFRTRGIWVFVLHNVFGLAVGLVHVFWHGTRDLSLMAGELAQMWLAVYLVGQGIAWWRLAR